MSVNYHNTGDILKKLRSDKNLSQKKLASIIGTGQDSISNAENGHILLTAEAYYNAAEYFGVSVDYLLDRKPPLPEPESPTLTQRKVCEMLFDIYEACDFKFSPISYEIPSSGIGKSYCEKCTGIYFPPKSGSSSYTGEKYIDNFIYTLEQVAKLYQDENISKENFETMVRALIDNVPETEATAETVEEIKGASVAHPPIF